MTLNGGTFIAAAAPANSPGTGATASFQMAANPGQNNSTPTHPYQFAVLNVNPGATLSIVSQLSMGQLQFSLHNQPKRWDGPICGRN